MNVQFIAEYENSTLSFNHCVKTNQTGHDNRPHYHDMYEILFIKEGNISYLTNDNVYPLRKNSLVFARPQQLHCIRVDRDTPYDRYDLLFAQETIPHSLLAKIPADLSIVSFETNPLAIQLFDKMDFYCGKLNGEQLARVLRSLIEEVIVNVLIYVQDTQNNPHIGKQPMTVQAMDYIAKNLLNLADVDTICRDLCISRSYLYQLFRNDLNTTPKHYITERKLNLARQEILLGAKVTSVYSQFGFTDYSTFFRAYKKHFGYPPTETHHASYVRTSEEDAFWGHNK